MKMDGEKQIKYKVRGEGRGGKERNQRSVKNSEKKPQLFEQLNELYQSSDSKDTSEYWHMQPSENRGF